MNFEEKVLLPQSNKISKMKCRELKSWTLTPLTWVVGISEALSSLVSSRMYWKQGTAARGSLWTYRQAALPCRGASPTASCLPCQSAGQGGERWSCLVSCLLTHLLSLASSPQELTVVPCPDNGLCVGRGYQTFWGQLVFTVCLHCNNY